MDGTKIHVAVNSLLECSVCLQVFQDPRMLQCGHTFCLQCIQKTTNRLCALCKTEWFLPTNGLQELPKNFVVESFITSLPSVYHCAVAGNSSHGPAKYLCIDCWDPMCEKCGQGHTQFSQYSRAMKNHVVKLISDIDQSDIESRNRQRALLCKQHKDKAIEYYCTNCDTFVCCSCYILYHNKHDCISVEDVDAKLCTQIDNSVKKIQESINLNDEMIKEVTLSKKTLENDKSKYLEALTKLIDDVKAKLKIEFKKLVEKVDDYYKNLVNLVNKQSEVKTMELGNFIDETRKKQESLKNILSSYKILMSPVTTPVERASFLKNNLITQLKLEVNKYFTGYHLPDISLWKNDIDNWYQSLMKLFHTVRELPQVTDSTRPILIDLRLRFVYYFFSAIKN